MSTGVEDLLNNEVWLDTEVASHLLWALGPYKPDNDLTHFDDLTPSDVATHVALTSSDVVTHRDTEGKIVVCLCCEQHIWSAHTSV